MLFGAPRKEVQQYTIVLLVLTKDLLDTKIDLNEPLLFGVNSWPQFPHPTTSNNEILTMLLQDWNALGIAAEMVWTQWAVGMK